MHELEAVMKVTILIVDEDDSVADDSLFMIKEVGS